jgi:peptidoglycan LD-endopeptidase CwlK
MSLDEALVGKEIPKDIRNTLTLVTVPYFSFDTQICKGQLVVHIALAEEVREIFTSLYEMRFPIERMTPIVAYGWDDSLSMRENNTSAFNYRFIACTDRLSNHAHGRALDINPMQNPYTQRDGVVVPSGARYDPTQPGTVTPEIAAIFKTYGWTWGGEWEANKDWQHFEKVGD